MKHKTLSLNGRRFRKTKPADLFRVSVTYNVVTPESSEFGDFAESGFEVKPHAASLKAVLELFEKHIGHCENFVDGSTNQSLYETDGSVNYRTGAETHRTLHVTGSPRVMRRLNALLSRETRIYEVRSLRLRGAK